MKDMGIDFKNTMCFLIAPDGDVIISESNDQDKTHCDSIIRLLLDKSDLVREKFALNTSLENTNLCFLSNDYAKRGFVLYAKDIAGHQNSTINHGLLFLPEVVSLEQVQVLEKNLLSARVLNEFHAASYDDRGFVEVPGTAQDMVIDSVIGTLSFLRGTLLKPSGIQSKR